MINEGDIVLAELVCYDRKYKKRPALVLKVFPKYGDLLLCGISTQLHQFILDFDFLIDNKNKEFLTSGLLKDSVIRLGYLSVIPSLLIEGKLGFISKETHKLLICRLCDILLK